jgi:cell division protease FtsH
MKQGGRYLKYFKGLSFYIVLFVIILFILTLYQNTDTPVELTYSDLLRGISENNIETIVLEGDKATVTFKKNPIENSRTDKYSVFIPDLGSFMDEVAEPIKNGQINFKTQPPPSAPWWVAILPTVGLIVIFVLFWVFFLQQSQGGGGSRVMSFGKSRAKMTTDQKKKVTFEDVAGADEEKEEALLKSKYLSTSSR